jgi:hypothetical protein
MLLGRTGDHGEGVRRLIRAGPRAVAAALVLLGLAVALATLPGQLSHQAGDAAAARRLPRVDGVTMLGPVGAEGTRFLAYARRTIPPGAAVRIVQRAGAPPASGPVPAGTPGVCGVQTSRLLYYWLVYAMFPRPSTCDTHAVWTVYFGVPPPAVLPRGARVFRFAPRYALVRA